MEDRAEGGVGSGVAYGAKSGVKSVVNSGETRGARIGLRRPSFPLVRALPLILVFAAALSGCTFPRIQVDSSDPAVLRGAAGFDVLLAPAKSGSQAALPDEATTALLDRVREALRAKGHPSDVDAGTDGRRPVVLELALRKQQVSRRTYTSDTDANGVRLVKRTEAIVALRAIDGDGEVELWRCEARGLLPERGRSFGPSETELFDRLLERALDRMPARS